MSILDRVSAFVEDGDILAPAFEEEFDNIAEALNGLFVMDEAAGTESIQQILSTSYADVTGAAKSFTTTRNMKLLVVAFGEINTPHTEVIATLNVDGTDRARTFHLYSTEGDAGATPATAYVVSLSPGSHELKLRAKKEGSGICGIKGSNSGFAYIGVAT